MRISTAYFAGVGTVIVAVAAGLGGGYFAANIANPPPGVSKLERRMSAEPISVAAAPAQPAPRAVATSPTAVSNQEQPQSQQELQKVASAPSDNAVPSSAAAPSRTNVRVEERPANNNVAVSNVAAVPAVQPAPQPAKPIETKSVEQSGEKVATPREAFAKAREADLKRADAEKRRAERRQAWAERRRVQSPREELEAVEERVREVTEPRRIRIREESEPREMFAEPARGDLPRIRLFDRED